MGFKDIFSGLKGQRASADFKNQCDTAGELFRFNQKYGLDNKVDSFMDWYFKIMSSGFRKSESHRFAKDMRNFIEKMAVWYELRYPDYEVERLIRGNSEDSFKINDVMFKDNTYIQGLSDDDSVINNLDWGKFFNTQTFINSLPESERVYFDKPKYVNLVYYKLPLFTHFHLSANGRIMEAEGVKLLRGKNGNSLSDADLEGMHIKDAVKIMKENGIEFSEDNEIEMAIRNYENCNYQKEEMLNCVMYRLIERGGSNMGPKRAFLFAREFGRNIDIPMMYGVNFFDIDLRIFLNEYLKAGGRGDLECVVGYFDRFVRMPKLMTVNRIFEFCSCIRGYSYSDEEKRLQKKLVDVLANAIDYDEKKEQGERDKVKVLRIQRKLEKSRKNGGR